MEHKEIDSLVTEILREHYNRVSSFLRHNYMIEFTEPKYNESTVYYTLYDLAQYVHNDTPLESYLDDYIVPLFDMFSYSREVGQIPGIEDETETALGRLFKAAYEKDRK